MPMTEALQHPETATSYSSILGQMISRARTQLTLNQADIASALGITQAAWSRIERGTTSITAEQLRTVATLLGREPYEVMREADAAARVIQENGVALVPPKDYDDLIKNGVMILIGAALGAALLHLYMKSKS